jgi:class 3 adenylate cyclase
MRQAFENTFSLLADNATTNIDLLQSRITGQLDPVIAAGTALAERIGDQGLDPDKSETTLMPLLRGALLTLPQTTAVIFVGADRKAVRLLRNDGKIQNLEENPFIRKQQARALDWARQIGKPSWAEPLWIPILGQPVLSFLAPVKHEDKLFGVVIISIRLGTLADFLKRLEARSGARAFVLYDKSRVLAHPALLAHDYDLTGNPDEVTLPRVDRFDEPAFRLLKPGAERAERLLERSSLTDAPFDDEFILLMREITDYGPKPWQIGLRYRQADVAPQLDRLREMGLAGLAILALAVIIGFLFSRSLNRQVGRLALAADKLRRLETADAPQLPDSRIRELSNAAGAFNAMVQAMRWFETYLPKTLVLRLMEAGDSRAMVSEEREMTVMFTDIRGFSTLAEHMAPAEIADLLNEHFETLASAIEKTGGTVDKFIGDAVMAFWGAPEHQPDHAVRALRAAVGIEKAVARENTRRRKAGLADIGVRVGLHTGPVVVGNIGSRARVNYTVVGDTVNVAARLEAHAKTVKDGSEDCIVLVSGEVLAAAGGKAAQFDVAPLGKITVKGRKAPVDVCRLGGGAGSAKPPKGKRRRAVVK